MLGQVAQQLGVVLAERRELVALQQDHPLAGPLFAAGHLALVTMQYHAA